VVVGEVAYAPSLMRGYVLVESRRLGLVEAVVIDEAKVLLCCYVLGSINRHQQPPPTPHTAP